MSDFCLSLSGPRSLFLCFFSPVQVRRGSDRVASVGTWHPARLKHHTPVLRDVGITGYCSSEIEKRIGVVSNLLLYLREKLFFH